MLFVDRIDQRPRGRRRIAETAAVKHPEIAGVPVKHALVGQSRQPMHHADLDQFELDRRTDLEHMRQRRFQEMLSVDVRRLDRIPAFRMIEIDRPRRDAVKIGFRNNREEREAVLIRWPQELSGFGSRRTPMPLVV